MPRISLVLATYGRSDLIARFVESLRQQSCKHFELIVVDQNPDGRVLPYMQQARDAGVMATHLKMDRPNLSAARNMGIAHASGDVIGFPDDDCWYDPRVIETTLCAFSENPHWQGVVAQWVEERQAVGSAAVEAILSNAKWRQFRDGEASSITLFLRTNLLKQLGGFDDRFGVGQWFGAGEETDLILSALSAGAVLARCQDIRVHHRYALPSMLPLSNRWWPAVNRSRGTGALYLKHRLPWKVVVRGFLAPPFMAVFKRTGLEGLLLGLALSVGRFQGAMAWLLRAR